MGSASPTYDKVRTRYERSRKLLKWFVFTLLVSTIALLSGDTWKPENGEVYFSAASVVIAGFGEVLFDRRNNGTHHQGCADYTRCGQAGSRSAQRIPPTTATQGKWR